MFMKRLKVVLCALLALSVLFAATACGTDEFSGSFKNEATTEQITAMTADVKNAAGDSAVDTVKEASGVKLALEMYTKSVSDGKTSTSKMKTTYETAVVDGKVVSATEVEGEAKDGDEKKEIEYGFYFNDDKVYANVNGAKKYVSVGTPVIGNQVAEYITKMVNRYVMSSAMSAYVDDIVAFGTEQLSTVGIKVYIDDSGKTTKIKYSVPVEYLAEQYKMDKENVSLKEYSIILLLNSDKKLTGVKTVVDFTLKRGESSYTTQINASVLITDKKPSMPSFKKYEEITKLTDITDMFKATD